MTKAIAAANELVADMAAIAEMHSASNPDLVSQEDREYLKSKVPLASVNSIVVAGEVKANDSKRAALVITNTALPSTTTLPSVEETNAKYRKAVGLAKEAWIAALDVGRDLYQIKAKFKADQKRKPKAERINFWLEYFPTQGYECSDKTARTWISCYEGIGGTVEEWKQLPFLTKTELYNHCGVGKATAPTQLVSGGAENISAEAAESQANGVHVEGDKSSKPPPIPEGEKETVLGKMGITEEVDSVPANVPPPLGEVKFVEGGCVIDFCKTPFFARCFAALNDHSDKIDATLKTLFAQPTEAEYIIKIKRAR